jgi:hypothetical protein
VSFVLVCFQASAAPRPENSDSDEKDALFGVDTEITTMLLQLSRSRSMSGTMINHEPPPYFCIYVLIISLFIIPKFLIDMHF